MKKSKILSLFSVVLITLLIGTLAFNTLQTSTLHGAETENEEEQATEEINESGIIKSGFADIAETTKPSLVKVTSKIEKSSNKQFPFNDPFFEDFFGDRLPESEEEPDYQDGFGSGFVVSEDGYIVTNEHVIHEAKEIEVEISGFDEPLEAEVAWAEPELDLAILNVKQEDIEEQDEELVPLEMGNSDEIRPGEWAIAIGNPLELEHTVTVGVISALGRPINIPTSDGVRSYRNLIQTDAAINPGNSGGPLLNIEGEAIGINTAVSMQGQGIGFAIPIKEVKGYVEELIETGEIVRPWLGVAYQPVTEEHVRQLDLDDTKGVLVNDVIADSPAEKAGLKIYDVIVEVNKEPIEEASDLPEIINELDIDQEVMIRVIRNGESQILTATIGERPERY
ncbi:MAG: S1C family serine protease [Halanaerobiaceae bacterium]